MGLGRPPSRERRVAALSLGVTRCHRQTGTATTRIGPPATLVGRIIFGYNDNHAAAAPVGTFAANAKGIYDLGGNVAEWVNDFYQHPAPEGTPPLGPAAGEYHVIRGSSWMHGTTTELRLSFRDYGIDGRRDLGFRLARFAEAEP